MNAGLHKRSGNQNTRATEEMASNNSCYVETPV